jgi:hypothetical protein
VIHVVKMGPIEEGPDTTSIYACIADGGVVPHMGAATETDSAALEEILQKLGPERRSMVRCEPRMAAAGEELGIEATALSKEHGELVAAMACDINARKLDVKMGHRPVIDLLRAAAGAYQMQAEAPFTFEMLAPFPSGTYALFTVHIPTDVDTMAVLGASLGEPPRGKHKGQSRMLGVGFKDEPAWLIDRMEATFGLSKAVVPFRAVGSDLETVDAEDLGLLTHARPASARADQRAPPEHLN